MPSLSRYERIRTALRAEWPDRRPIMLHNFQCAAAEAGYSMREFRRSPEAIARSFIQAVETYDYDGIVVDVDTATLAAAVGVPVDLPDGLPARCAGPALEHLDQAWSLPPVDIGAHAGVQVWLEATRLLSRYFGHEVWIRGNCDQAPFSLACLMRGIENWMLDLTDESLRPAADRLLEYCTEAVAQFLTLMAATGAHMVSNGDSLAGLVSARTYRSFAFPSEQALACHAHSLGLPCVLHVCGKVDRILGDLAEVGADGLELDQETDMRRARETLTGSRVFIGNLDPSAVLCRGSAALVAEKTRELLDVFRATPRFILNAGCALPANTPGENLRAMIRAAREYPMEPAPLQDPGTKEEIRCG